MRQVRKRRTFRPVLGVLFFGGVLAASVSALSWAGWIHWNTDAVLSDFAFWSHKSTAPTDNRQSSGKETQTPQKGAGVASGTPNAPKKNGTDQLLAQAQSLVPVKAGERAWLDQLGTVKLDPDTLFSLNAWIKEVLKNNKFETKEEELSHVAGLLYESALRTGLAVGERYPHQDLPDYAASGFDVFYSPDAKDLTIYNPFDFAVTAGVAYTGDVPIVYFAGTPTEKWKAPKIQVVKETFAPEKIVLSDFSLPAGEVTRDNGKDGLLVKVYGDYLNNGQNVLIAKDFYAPHPQVIARAPSPEEARAAKGQ